MRNVADKIHVLAFTSALGGGGAEMHLLRVLNHLDRHRFRLSLALARPGGAYEAALADDVQVRFLNLRPTGSSTLSMLRAAAPLRKLLQSERPDLLLSVMDHANLIAVLATRALPVRPKLLLSVQIPPSLIYGSSRNPVCRLTFLLIPRLYPRADRIIALSAGVAQDLEELLPGSGSRIAVTYNAGVDARVLAGAREPLVPGEVPPPGPLVVACGRLAEQKGYTYLLDAFAQVRRQVPASLWIVGEGELRRFLEEKIQQLGLTGSVRLLGFQKNPYKYMAAADVFVLSSLYEGFGNVVVEAMASNAPVVATDCPYGPAEIIRDGFNGLLVPPANAAALAQAITRVLTDPVLKRQLATQGAARARDFSAAKIAAAYGDLLLHVYRGEPHSV